MIVTLFKTVPRGHDRPDPKACLRFQISVHEYSKDDHPITQQPRQCHKDTMDRTDSSSSGSRSPSTERPGSSSRRSSQRGSEVSQLTSSRPKPSRLEFSSYVSLLRDLKRDAADRPLTSRLLERWVPRVSVSASSTPAPPSPRLSASDGPGWTRGRREVSSDLESISSLSETVVVNAQADERLDDRWPLEVEALQPTEVDLAEMIRTIAARQIRTKKLSLPTPRSCQTRRRTGSYPVEGSASGSAAESEVTEGSTIDELEDEALPLDIVESTTAFLDQVLVGLAAMRPKETRTKRKGMDAIGWEGVVGAAGLIRGNEG